MNPQVVVIAAGLGTRLRPLTERYAKPVLPIDGKPVIALLLRELAEAGFDAVTVVIGHLGEQVERLIGDGRGFGLAVRYARQASPDGSADAVLAATPVAPYLVLGADKRFTRGDIGRFAAAFAASGAAGAIAVEDRPGTVQIRDGLVERVLGKGRVACAALGCRAGACRPRRGASRQATLRARASVSTCDRRGRACSGDRDRPDARSDGAGRRARGELPLPEEPVTEAYDYFQQGRAHLKDGMAAQATVALEKAKKLEPDKASIREALGIAYFRIQRWKEAEAEFRAVLELSPTDDYAHYALGRALEKQGRDAEANGHYKLASSLSPNSEHYAERIMELDRSDEPGDERTD